MKRLFIADPSLKDRRGHHYNLTRAITDSANQLGYLVFWLCSSEFEECGGPEGVTIDPVFRTSMYQQYMLHNTAKQKPKSLFSRLFPGKHITKPVSINQTQQFVEDLSTSLLRFEVTDQDRILIHTADGDIFRALPRLLMHSNNKSLPRFHVGTPYNPTGIMPNKGDAAEIDTAIFTLRNAGLIDSQLYLYGENEPLANHLANRWSAPVRPLDLPVRPPTAERLNKAKKYRHEKLGMGDDDFLVISLGSARLEKGFDKFPDIISALAMLLREEPIKPSFPKINFVLQASPQIIGRHPKIAETIDTLQTKHGKLVDLILDPLSEDDYENLLFASDAVVMPYSIKDYAIRGSMIVTEASMAGKLIVATEGTYPGYAATRMHGKTAAKPADFAKAILDLAKNQKETTKQLEQAKTLFIEKNNFYRYWQKCLDAEKNGAQ